MNGTTLTYNSYLIPILTERGEYDLAYKMFFHQFEKYQSSNGASIAGLNKDYDRSQVQKVENIIKEIYSNVTSHGKEVSGLVEWVEAARKFMGEKDLPPPIWLSSDKKLEGGLPQPDVIRVSYMNEESSLQLLDKLLERPSNAEIENYERLAETKLMLDLAFNYIHNLNQVQATYLLNMIYSYPQPEELALKAYKVFVRTGFVSLGRELLRNTGVSLEQSFSCKKILD